MQFLTFLHWSRMFCRFGRPRKDKNSTIFRTFLRSCLPGAPDLAKNQKMTKSCDGKKPKRHFQVGKGAISGSHFDVSGGCRSLLSAFPLARKHSSSTLKTKKRTRSYTQRRFSKQEKAPFRILRHSPSPGELEDEG